VTLASSFTNKRLVQHGLKLAPEVGDGEAGGRLPRSDAERLEA